MQHGHADLGGSRSPCSTRPTTWPISASCRSSRRLLDKTPARRAADAVLGDAGPGVDVLVKRYLHNPVTHSVDSAQSPVSTMAHHVLHIDADARLGGARRPDVGTRPHPGLHPHQARRQAAGAQADRCRRACRRPARQPVAGRPHAQPGGVLGRHGAKTLVATDIAARGIHVDDIALVIHADPPVEHKAYLHRSGRTARAGASGTVVTLMTDAQVSDVRDLTRKAGIKPTITRSSVGHPLLAEIAPGERVLVKPSPVSERDSADGGSGHGGRRRNPRGSTAAAATAAAATAAATAAGTTTETHAGAVGAPATHAAPPAATPVAQPASRPVRVGAAVADAGTNVRSVLPRAGRTGRFLSAPMSLRCTTRQTW